MLEQHAFITTQNIVSI